MGIGDMKEAKRKGVWSTPSWTHVSIFSNPVGILGSFPLFLSSSSRWYKENNEQLSTCKLTYKVLFKNYGFICIFLSSTCLSGPNFSPSQFYLYMYW